MWRWVQVLTDFEADEEVLWVFSSFFSSTVHAWFAQDMLRKALEESCREAGLATDYEDAKDDLPFLPILLQSWLDEKIAASEK